MKIHSLGHVVLKVRDRAKAEAFYRGVLGLPVAARSDKLRMTFLTLGHTHHDFAIAQVGEDAALPTRNAVGLSHVAFKIGEDIETLRRAKAELDAAGITCNAADHGVSKSLYCADPDGNRIELYVDQSDDWKRDPQAVAVSSRLRCSRHLMLTLARGFLAGVDEQMLRIVTRIDKRRTLALGGPLHGAMIPVPRPLPIPIGIDGLAYVLGIIGRIGPQRQRKPIEIHGTAATTIRPMSRANR